MNKGDLARQNFKSGYNCSQSVALAFCDEMGMDAATVARLTIGFGGGMGRMREVCGAVSGVTFVLSALHGDRPKNQVYAMVQQVAKGFQAETGSLVCRVLLGLDPGEQPTPQAEARTESYYKKRPCAELCALAANLLEEYLKNIA